MKKHRLEHLIRAAGSITGCREIYIVGSQAILATVSSGPPELFLSREGRLPYARKGGITAQARTPTTDPKAAPAKPVLPVLTGLH